MITNGTTCDALPSVSSLDTSEDEPLVEARGTETLRTYELFDTGDRRAPRWAEADSVFRVALRSILHNLTAETLTESLRPVEQAHVRSTL